MRLLLVIDDTLQELEATAFKVSSGEFEDYDTVIMIDTTDVFVPISEEEKKNLEGKLHYLAEGVNRPSKEGISLMPFEKRSLVDILSDIQAAELAEMRNDKHIVILPMRPQNHKRIQKKFVVHTKKYEINKPNSIDSALREMVAIEDLKLKGNLLYLVQEPVMIPKANDTFYLQEIVDVYGPIEEKDLNVTEEESTGSPG